MSKRAAVRWAVAKWTALALAALLLALILWKWRDWQASARMGAAYAARLTCSCRYVEGRSAESCAQDIRHETRLVSVTERPEQRRIIARVPLLGRAEAGFRPGYGCLIQP
ncbi:MAG: hypothetical protein B7Z20_09850 [Sphingobium sp. 32-64-5]|nr:MAG: hypothetical protein B7Z20_09850 [Sphingobium sp. 32-64-5]